MATADPDCCFKGRGTRCFAGGRKNTMLDSFLNLGGGGGEGGGRYLYN